MSGDAWTEDQLDAEVRRLKYLYPDGQKWWHRLHLKWLEITDQEAYAFESAAWAKYKEDQQQTP